MKRQSLCISLLCGWVGGCAADDADAADDTDVRSSVPEFRSLTYSKITADPGSTYVAQCESYGVPIPDTILDLDRGWIFPGDTPGQTLESTFIRPNNPAELWMYDAGDGLCMALPRFAANDPGTIEVLGVICMADTGETCFFVNEEGVTFSFPAPLGDQIEFADLLGGADLAGNIEGVCSDCHAGANPFVVHPDDPFFLNALDISPFQGFRPSNWPTPIVPAAWPGNPPPITSLGPTTGQDCSSGVCHSELGRGGPLPLVSSDFPGFCLSVLGPAVGALLPDTANTMPPEDGIGVIADYTEHRDWLLGACNIPPNQGQIVRFEPPAEVPVLPPTVAVPYACSFSVRVTSALLGANLTLTVNNVPAGAGVTSHPSGYSFSLVDKLGAGDVIAVEQTVGTDSAVAAVVVVDYPGDLPPPQITSAPVYRCAQNLGVTNVPGTKIVVEKTDAGSGTTSSFTQVNNGYHLTWMNLGAGGEFEIGDSFTASQELCNESSDPSEPVVAVEPPPLTALTFARPRVGQEFISLKSIVQGSALSVKEQPSTAVFGTKSYPWTSYVNVPLEGIGAVESGDEIVAWQELCDESSPLTDVPIAQECDPATLVPQVATPMAGDDFVLVVESVPGALIRVFGKDNDELGNGTGSVIALTRGLFAGETIIVTESLPTCLPTRGFSVVTQP